MRKNNELSMQAFSSRLALSAAFLYLLAESGGANAAVINVCSNPTHHCYYTNVQQAINAAQNGDKINIGPGIFAGPLILGAVQNLTISGKGPTITVIQQYDRLPNQIEQGIVTCDGTASIAISGLTITGNGGYSDLGRGIHNHCTMDVKNVKIQKTGTTLRAGGGIFNEGTMTVSNSTVQNNRAPGGGGIENLGTLTVKNSDIESNIADSTGALIGGGGGIENRGVLTLLDVNVQNNTAVNFGSGISNSGTVLLKRSNVHGHANGIGIYNFGTLQLQNSFIDHNGIGIFEGDRSVIQTAGQTLFLDNDTDCKDINGPVSCPFSLVSPDGVILEMESE